MNDALPERPTTSRRLPKPAADVNVDPIENLPIKMPGVISVPASQKVLRTPVSTRLDDETIYILNRVKLDEKLKIYEAIELAVKEKWGSRGFKK
uniref:hypothetical protein n=1 Tax=Arthrobacter sp. TaxID=1667 RepID=UPI000EB6F9EC|nr:hypothetical protein [Arthrobacter sp.]AXV46293.1 putative partitioning protein ParB [Arthrobacter sp.]